jgi:hypothetical protein
VIEVRIPFGMKNGRLVVVDSVEKGLACNCTCPCCDAPLQARKGGYNQHHFSHVPSEIANGCKGAAETATHLMAKQIIEEERCFLFPRLEVSECLSDVNKKSHVHKEFIQSDALIEFDEVELEKHLGNIVPDVLAKQNNEQYIIEIAVTHVVSDAKKLKLKALGIPAIEMRIIGTDHTKAQLADLIMGQVKNKQWLFHPKTEQARSSARSILKNKLSQIKRTNKSTNNFYFANKYKESETLKVKPKTYGEVNWILCEYCRHYWSVSLKGIQEAKGMIICEKCNRGVKV